MKKVAVSIHAVEDFKPQILEGIRGFDYIHVDVMDGKFVNNTNNNLNVFRILKEIYNIHIIVHLMVINPVDYIEEIIQYVDYFLFHFEIKDDIDKIVEEVKKYNKKVGLAINPTTEISEIIQYLKNIDIVLVMSVNPGWSGQKFIPDIVKKIDKLAEFKEAYDFIIDVDGGIDLVNAKLLKNTDILTSSSSILKAENPNRIIKLLRESDQND
jgi:ribulose-phosphate 3-epimerase